MNKIYMLLPLVALAAAFAEEPGGRSPSNMNDSLIECKAALRHDSRAGYAIQISIKNIGQGDLVFFEDQLPWRSSLVTTLVAIPLNVSEPPIVPILKLIDLTVKRVTLKPGKLLEGEIILKERFSGWDQLVANKEVSVFWSFIVEDAEARGYGRYSGYSIIK